MNKKEQNVDKSLNENEDFGLTNENIKNKFNTIDIPKSLDDVIEKAANRGEQEKKSFRRKGKFKFIRKSAIAAACFIFIIVSANISPVFADYLCKIPGFEVLIDIFTYDRGMQKCINNGFAQTVNKEAEDKGITIRVDDIILDKKNFIVLYSIEAQEPYYNLVMRNFVIKDSKGNKLPMASQSPTGDTDSNVSQNLLIIKYGYDIDELGEEIILECMKIDAGRKKSSREDIKGNWKIEFKIDKSKLKEAEPVEYSLNKKVKLDKLDFKIEYVKIHPTTIDMKVSIDENSKYKYLGFKNQYLEDENGNIYSVSSSTRVSDTEQIISFNSNYFTRSKSLKFTADGAYIMPKEDQYVIVNLKNKKVIDDSGYNIEFEYDQSGTEAFLASDEYKCDYSLCLQLKDKEMIESNVNPPIELGQARDENNNKYDTRMSWISRGGWDIDNESEFMGIIVEFSNMKKKPEILKFKIFRAYKEITKPFEIKLFD